MAVEWARLKPQGEVELADRGIFLRGDGGCRVMLLHGLTGCPTELGYLAHWLRGRGRYHVSCPRLVNHGQPLGVLARTTSAQLYQSAKDAFFEARAAARAEGVPLIIGGLSLGANLSLMLAAEFPEDVAGAAARGLPGPRRAGGAGRRDRPEECAVHHRACRLAEARAAAAQAVLPPGVRRPGAGDRCGPSAAILRLSRPAEERVVKGGALACQDRCLSRCCSSISTTPSCRATSSTRSSRSTRRTRRGATGKMPGRKGIFRPGIACGCRSGTCACPASGCSRT